MSSTPQEGSLEPSEANFQRGRSSTARSYLSSANEIKQSVLRGAIAREMASEMVECSIKTFRDHYMPFTPDEKDVDKCIDHLVKKDLIAKGDNGMLTWAMWKKKEKKPRGRKPKASGEGNEKLESVGQGESKIGRDMGDGNNKEGGKEQMGKLKEPKETEAERFGHFVNIVRSIREYTMSDNRTASVSYINCLNNNIASEIAGGHFKIDGCFSFLSDPGLEERKLEGKLTASTIAVPAEFKLSMSERSSNSVQLLSCANHIMNDDPCRMFTYGINMEDEEMTVWHYSRSHSCKSEPFNFVTDCRTTVTILMGFIFAKLEELGLDPTVHRIHPTHTEKEGKQKSRADNEGKGDIEQNTIQYVHEIGNEGQKRFFKTIRSLFSYRSLRITGRSTRVWEAIEVSDATGTTVIGKKRVALKDVWLDEGARTEGMNQKDIFCVVETLGGIPEDLRNELHPDMGEAIEDSIKNNSYKKYFMGIDCDWQGKTSKSKATDAHRVKNFTKPFETSASYGFMPGSDPSRSTTPSYLPSVTQPTVNLDDGREFRPKRQYRLVYSEVAKSLAHVSNFKEAGGALQDACIALGIMWLAGWVHRDISVGNILYTLNSNNEIQGKLSDLEYAKEFQTREPCSPDPKTGTPYFMATEILLRRYLTGRRSLPKTSYTKGINAKHFDFGRRRVDPVAPSLSLVYNYQHDLESIFWIVLWLITSHLDYAPSQSYGQLIFVASTAANEERERFQIFLGDNHLLRQLPAPGEAGKVFHKSLEAFVEHLNVFVQQLRNACIERAEQYSHAIKASYTSVFNETFYTCQVVEAIHHLRDPDPPRLRGSNTTNKENDPNHKRGLSEATMAITIQDPPKKMRQAQDKSTEDISTENNFAEWIPRSPICRRL